MIAWLARAQLVMLVCGGVAVCVAPRALAQDAPARRPAAAATAPAPAPAPQRELIYVVIGREPTGDPSALLRALEAVLADGRPAVAAPDHAATAGATPSTEGALASSEGTDAVAAEAAVDEAAMDETATASDEVADADASAEPVEGEALSSAPDESALAATDAPARSEWQEMGILPWSLLGLGAAGLVGGALTGALVLESRSELDTMCTGGVCTGDAADALGRTNTLADVSTALLIGGGTSLAAGLIWLLVADAIGGDEPAGETPWASLSCDGQGCAAQLGTRF